MKEIIFKYMKEHGFGEFNPKAVLFDIISEFGDISTIKWNYITPNDNNDWIGQRNETFSTFIALGDRKKSETVSFFSTNIATGIVTSRDSWVYGFSKTIILSKINDMIATYNAEVARCWRELEEQQEQHIISSSDKKASETFLMNIRSNDATRISWSAGLTNDFCRGKMIDRYPLNEWAILEQKLKALPLTKRDARAFVRFLYSAATLFT